MVEFWLDFLEQQPLRRAASVTAAGEISTTFAQSENMTDGGNATEGSIPPSLPDTSGGMASPAPPAMTPK